MKKGLVIGLAVLIVMGLATMGMANTTVHVDWSSPNPDIQVLGSTYHTSAWAGVSGSGDVANGEITFIQGWPSGPPYHQTIAWQTANFTGGDYTAQVGASHPDYNSTIHSFNVQGADSSTVEQEASSMPGFAQVEGWQTYSAEGADLVIAGGLVKRDFWTWDTPQSVTYTGNAYGDVVGSQRSWTNCVGSGEAWNSPGLGFGAGISGTEGTTYFEFDINTPTSNPGTLHTVVIGSGGQFGLPSSAVGESHTWLENSVLDDDFNWIE